MASGCDVTFLTNCAYGTFDFISNCGNLICLTFVTTGKSGGFGFGLRPRGAGGVMEITRSAFGFNNES